MNLYPPKYQITLLVTVEEEMAIMHFFFTKGWQYVNLNACTADTREHFEKLRILASTSDSSHTDLTSQTLSSQHITEPHIAAPHSQVTVPDYSGLISNENNSLYQHNTEEVQCLVTERQNMVTETYSQDAVVHENIKEQFDNSVNGKAAEEDTTEIHIDPPSQLSSASETTELSDNEQFSSKNYSRKKRKVQVRKILTKNNLHSVASKKLKAARQIKTAETVKKTKCTVKKKVLGEDPVLIGEDRNLTEMSLLVFNQCEENQIFCCICDLSFNDFDLFKEHANNICLKELQKAEKPTTFKCKDCRGYYKNAFTLVRHRLSQVCQPGKAQKVGKFLKCAICDKVYPKRRQTDFTLHVMLHNNNRPHSCDECGKQFIRWTSLRDHKRVHTGETPYPCSYCPKAFVTKSHRRNHELNRHIEVPRSFVCEKCGATFKFKGWLTTHVKEVHSDARNHSCSICNKQFKRRGSLTEHMKTHSVRDKVCHICGKAFHRQTYLNKHAKRHTDDRQFKCEECKKAFFTKQNLDQHMRVHSGEKPFACTACTYKCTTRGNLKKHVKAIHPEIKM